MKHPQVSHLMTETNAAVVVAFNRKELLTECLDGLLGQTLPLDAIYVVDNASTDGTGSFLKERGYLANQRIRYLLMPENRGGAGGFYHGMRAAFEAGYDWLWLMDDDSEPEPDALRLMSPLKDFAAIAAIANRKVDVAGRTTLDGLRLLPNQTEQSVPYPLVKFTSFVGILIRSVVIEMIGFPRQEFFIHNDDYEYCLRLRRVGNIALARDSIVAHKEQARQITPRKLFGLFYLPKDIESYCFEYFGHRNYVAAQQEHGNSLTRILLPLRRMLLALSALLLFDRTDRWQRIKILLRANLDGYRGHFDNTYPFRLREALRARDAK